MILSLALLFGAQPDFMGTRTYIEPVTQQRSVVFAIEEDSRSLKVGCDKKGSGEVSITIQPSPTEQPSERLFSPTLYRFDGQEKPTSNQWYISGEQLVFDDARLRGIQRKASFLDMMAKSEALYIRFNSYDYQISAVFHLGRRVIPELRKMLVACAPPKVMQELTRMQSPLASSPTEAELQTTKPRDASKLKNERR